MRKPTVQMCTVMMMMMRWCFSVCLLLILLRVMVLTHLHLPLVPLLVPLLLPIADTVQAVAAPDSEILPQMTELDMKDEESEGTDYDSATKMNLNCQLTSIIMKCLITHQRS